MLSFLKANFKITAVAICLLWGAVGIETACCAVLHTGVVNSYQLNVREKPSRKSAVVVVIKKGEKVMVIGKEGGIGGWLHIQYKDKKGYIRNRPRYVRLMAPPADPTAEKAAKEKIRDKEKKKELEKEIKVQEEIVQSFSQKEVEIIEGLNEIDYALNKARINVTALATEIEQLEAKIQDLTLKKDALERQMKLSNAYTKQRLRALYKMNMIGRLEVSGPPGSVFDFLLQQNSMKRILAADFSVIEKQNRDFERYETLQGEFQREISAKTALEGELNDQIRINKKETLKREMILKEIRKKKKLSLAAVESLKNAAMQLDNRINSLKGESGSDFSSSFSNFKGRLIRPVKGKVISRFGPSTSGDHKSFTFQKGIDIKVERGEPVKSVFKGEVMFAQWLKGYGNLMIINHGDNYYTLYAHVEEIFKQKGEKVETGEVIATAGDTGSIKGMCLHFEVRHHGKPVNPLKWLRKGA